MKIDWCLEPKTVELRVGSYDLYTTITTQFYIMSLCHSSVSHDPPKCILIC